MELPVARQSYQPSADALVRAVKRGDMILARMLADEAQLDGATVFTNADRDRVDIANYACEIALADDDDPDALLDRVAKHFTRCGTVCRLLQAAGTDWPEPLTQAAQRRGYQPGTDAVYMLDGYRPPARLNERLQIIPARAGYAQLRQLYDEYARNACGGDDSASAQLTDALVDRLDEPRFEMAMGRIDGQPVGTAGVLSLGQIGVIAGVYTAPAHRRAGVATTLLAHTLDHCQRALFEHVIVQCPQGAQAAADAALYERFGFKSVVSFASYHKKADG